MGVPGVLGKPPVHADVHSCFEMPELAQPRALAPFALSWALHKPALLQPKCGGSCPAWAGVQQAADGQDLQHVNQELWGLFGLDPGWDLPKGVLSRTRGVSTLWP